jgi:hypothetical protein
MLGGGPLSLPGDRRDSKTHTGSHHTTFHIFHAPTYNNALQHHHHHTHHVMLRHVMRCHIPPCNTSPHFALPQMRPEQWLLSRGVYRTYNKALSMLKALNPLLATIQRSHLMLVTPLSSLPLQPPPSFRHAHEHTHTLMFTYAQFFFFGTYLQLSHRIAGVRYLFLRKLRQPRPGYQLLGSHRHHNHDHHHLDLPLN